MIISIEDIHVGPYCLLFCRKFSGDALDSFHFLSNFVKALIKQLHCPFHLGAHFVLLVIVLVDLIAENVVQLSNFCVDNYLISMQTTPVMQLFIQFVIFSEMCYACAKPWIASISKG